MALDQLRSFRPPIHVAVSQVRTPAAPIGDPWLFAMEVLTIVSAFGIAGWVVASFLLATPDQRAFEARARR